MAGSELTPEARVIRDLEQRLLEARALLHPERGDMLAHHIDSAIAEARRERARLSAAARAASAKEV